MRGAATSKLTFALVSAAGVCLSGALTGCGPTLSPAPSATSAPTSTSASTGAVAAPFPPSSTTGVPVLYQVQGARLLADGDMALPLDGYDAYAHAADVELIVSAATRVEQACMRGKGFDLPEGFGSLYLPTPPPTLEFLGVTTVAQAKTTGYRLTAHDDGESSPVDPASVPAATWKAFDGPGGCAAAAYNTLGMRRADEAFRIVQDLRSRANDATAADPALKAGNARWSACMRSAGYDYSDPTAPGHDKSLLGRGLPVPPGATLPPVSNYERAVAQADVVCKQNTGYVQTYLSVAASHQNQLIASNQVRLRQLVVDWQGVLATARAHSG